MSEGGGEDLYSSSHYDAEWFARGNELSEATALQYFANSVFYDKTCINERAQQLGIDVRVACESQVGFEYRPGRAAEPAPNLFVIEKWLWDGKARPELRATFYILDRVIYQAPDLGAVVAARMRRASYFLREALRAAQEGVEVADGVMGWKEAVREEGVGKEDGLIARSEWVGTASSVALVDQILTPFPAAKRIFHS
jgi:MED6 mediator sub complex component